MNTNKMKNKFDIELADLILAEPNSLLDACTCIRQINKYIDAFILYKNCCLEALSTIACEGKSDGDRITAIELISKIEGWEYSNKTEQTDSNVNDIKPNEVVKFIKDIERLLKTY